MAPRNQGTLRSAWIYCGGFSGYSYRNEAGTVFYLEEDCDAPKFLSRYENASGTPAILEKQSNSVRRLPRLHQ